MKNHDWSLVLLGLTLDALNTAVPKHSEADDPEICASTARFLRAVRDRYVGTKSSSSNFVDEVSSCVQWYIQYLGSVQRHSLRPRVVFSLSLR